MKAIRKQLMNKNNVKKINKRWVTLPLAVLATMGLGSIMNQATTHAANVQGGNSSTQTQSTSAQKPSNIQESSPAAQTANQGSSTQNTGNQSTGNQTTTNSQPVTNTQSTTQNESTQQTTTPSVNTGANQQNDNQQNSNQQNANTSASTASDSSQNSQQSVQKNQSASNSNNKQTSSSSSNKQTENSSSVNKNSSTDKATNSSSSNNVKSNSTKNTLVNNKSKGLNLHTTDLFAKNGKSTTPAQKAEQGAVNKELGKANAEMSNYMADDTNGSGQNNDNGVSPFTNLDTNNNNPYPGGDDGGDSNNNPQESNNTPGFPIINNDDDGHDHDDGALAAAITALGNDDKEAARDFDNNIASMKDNDMNAALGRMQKDAEDKMANQSATQSQIAANSANAVKAQEQEANASTANSLKDSAQLQSLQNSISDSNAASTLASSLASSEADSVSNATAEVNSNDATVDSEESKTIDSIDDDPNLTSSQRAQLIDSAEQDANSLKSNITNSVDKGEKDVSGLTDQAGSTFGNIADTGKEDNGQNTNDAQSSADSDINRVVGSAESQINGMSGLTNQQKSNLISDLDSDASGARNEAGQFTDSGELSSIANSIADAASSEGQNANSQAGVNESYAKSAETSTVNSARNSAINSVNDNPNLTPAQKASMDSEINASANGDDAQIAAGPGVNMGTSPYANGANGLTGAYGTNGMFGGNGTGAFGIPGLSGDNSSNPFGIPGLSGNGGNTGDFANMSNAADGEAAANRNNAESSADSSIDSEVDSLEDSINNDPNLTKAQKDSMDAAVTSEEVNDKSGIANAKFIPNINSLTDSLGSFANSRAQAASGYSRQANSKWFPYNPKNPDETAPDGYHYNGNGDLVKNTGARGRRFEENYQGDGDDGYGYGSAYGYDSPFALHPSQYRMTPYGPIPKTPEAAAAEDAYEASLNPYTDPYAATLGAYGYGAYGNPYFSAYGNPYLSAYGSPLAYAPGEYVYSPSMLAAEPWLTSGVKATYKYRYFAGWKPFAKGTYTPFGIAYRYGWKPVTKEFKEHMWYPGLQMNPEFGYANPYMSAAAINAGYEFGYGYGMPRVAYADGIVPFVNGYYGTRIPAEFFGTSISPYVPAYEVREYFNEALPFTPYGYSYGVPYFLYNGVAYTMFNNAIIPLSDVIYTGTYYAVNGYAVGSGNSEQANGSDSVNSNAASSSSVNGNSVNANTNSNATANSNSSANKGQLPKTSENKAVGALVFALGMLLASAGLSGMHLERRKNDKDVAAK